MKIDGKEIAKGILEDLKKKVRDLKEQGITPFVAIILVDNDPASVAYVNQKIKKAEVIGCSATVIRFGSDVTNQELRKKIEELNNDDNIHGIIAQRPLPNHIDSELINQATDPKKDIDAFRKDSPYQMPLAAAVLKILEYAYSSSEQSESRSSRFANAHSNNNFIEWLRGKNIVVIGKGETGGGPTIELLKKMGIEPHVIDSKTVNSEEITRNADIIVSTVGKQDIIKAENIKKGVILIGVGMHKGTDGKLHGDYNEEEIKDIASFYTPIPGGVGPINVAMLLKNLILAAKLKPKL